jgi:hypothetical protein
MQEKRLGERERSYREQYMYAHYGELHEGTHGHSDGVSWEQSHE